MYSELSCQIIEESDKEYFTRNSIANIALNNNCEKCRAKDAEGNCFGRGCEESETL